MDAFLFYIDDWLSSTKIALMNADEERGYLRLLLFAAKQEDCGIPDDPALLSRVSMLNAKWRKSSAKIRECFIEKNGRLYNERLLRECDRQKAYLESKAQNGRSGAKKRWRKDSETNGETMAEPLAKPSIRQWRDDGEGYSETMQTQTQAEKEKPNPQTPGEGDVALNGFGEFISAWDSVAGEASPYDWGEARDQWRKLPIVERLNAVSRLGELRYYPDDPTCKALPQNYLGRQMWKRAIRGKKPYRESEIPEWKTPEDEVIPRG